MAWRRVRQNILHAMYEARPENRDYYREPAIASGMRFVHFSPFPHGERLGAKEEGNFFSPSSNLWNFVFLGIRK
jgi:hypothetical protein